MFKRFLETKGISEAQYKEKTAAELQVLDKEYQDYFSNEIDKKLDTAVKTGDFDSLKSEFDALATELKEVKGDEYKSMKETIEDLSSQITELKEKGGKNEVKAFQKEVSDNIEAIKSIAKGISKGKEVVIKANVVRASIANNTEAVRLGSIGQLGVKQRALYDYFSKFPVSTGNHNGTIAYIDWDEATIVRAAAIVAEGAQFPESTAAFAEYTTKLQKIGDTLPVSEEFGEDEVLAASELENFIRVNVNTLIDTKIAVGAGGANDIEGLFTASPTYTAVSSGIADANIKDLVRKMRTAIVKTRGSKYSPNFVAANSDVIDQYILKKDANNNYMFDMETGTIAGLDIVEDNNLADNTLVVGDGRFGRIYEMNGVTVSEGYVNDQFTGDLKTLKARARLLFLIREVDKTGFLKSTDIGADLVTLAS
jgi:hypothetical protein